jgi:hypothetical protein
LKALIDFVSQGNNLHSHDDVPDEIREQLIAEEQQLVDRQPRPNPMSTPNFPPINITNVLPSSSHQSPAASEIVSISTPPQRLDHTVRLDIPGPLDVAVQTYSEWQKSRVVNETLKAEYQKACDITLEDGLDLEQVHEEQDPGFFMRSGVKRGVARRWTRDIEEWVKRYKLSFDPELL